MRKLGHNSIGILKQVFVRRLLMNTNLFVLIIVGLKNLVVIILVVFNHIFLILF